MTTPLFGEWLRGTFQGAALRLVIEEMGVGRSGSSRQLDRSKDVFV